MSGYVCVAVASFGAHTGRVARCPGRDHCYCLVLCELLVFVVELFAFHLFLAAEEVCPGAARPLLIQPELFIGVGCLVEDVANNDSLRTLALLSWKRGWLVVELTDGLRHPGRDQIVPVAARG